VDNVVLQWLKDFNEAHGPFKRVLELGSLNVNGTARDAFQNAKEYIGLDLRPGDGVDVVGKASDLRSLFQWYTRFDCIVATSFFEHDLTFWDTLTAIRGVLKSGGYLVLTVPTPDFPYHAEPKDYWRFQEDAIRDCFFAQFKDVHLDNPLWTTPAGHEHLRCQHLGAWGRL
jgi:SAM-dependent methyltransferase